MNPAHTDEVRLFLVIAVTLRMGGLWRKLLYSVQVPVRSTVANIPVLRSGVKWNHLRTNHQP